MKRKSPVMAVALAGLFMYTSCSPTEQAETKDYTQYVNTFIGAADNGHTFPGACYPFGMIQTSPVTGAVGWRYCSEYTYQDSLIWGFTQTHLNGTGCMDLGDILVMPVTGTRARAWDAYRSHFPKDKEAATPGYYTVELSDPQVKAELTASIHAALHRYTYHKADSASLLIDLQHGPAWREEQYHSQVNSCEVNWEDAQTLAGHVNNTVWVDQDYFFVMKFNRPVIDSLYLPMGETEKGKRIIATFDLKPGDELMMKVALSTTSVEGAKKNLQAEIPDWNFDGVKLAAHDEWNSYLSRMDVEGTDDEKTNFYTCFYHALIQPNQISDVDGMYRNAADSIVKAGTGTFYSTFSLWDTYRAAHPLYTLVQPERVPDFINSMLAIYEQQGRLPVWHLYGSDTNEMIGIQSVPVIADAILKDVKGFNYERAYQAMKASMMSDYKGLSYVTDLEYIPADKENESVAKGLEYAIADWGVAQVARKLGKTEDYEYFSKRALAYQNYWDKDTHFFRGKNRDGSWVTPFNPVHSTHRNDAYCEGNGWQYTWLVPHDVEGLISLFGSKEAFVSKLDSLFLVNEDLGDAASPDISGLIGQYAHGNEPGHHTVYLYSFVGQQWKTAEKVDYILSHMYSDLPDGLQGNEDCGQMSSWYVFSALGFYPVNPSDGMYVFGRPIFDKVVLKLPENKVFEIRANNNSAENKYIQSIELNGQPYNKLYISHADIMAGGTLVFTMGNRPNEQFGMITQSSVETDIN